MFNNKFRVQSSLHIVYVTVPGSPWDGQVHIPNPLEKYVRNTLYM